MHIPAADFVIMSLVLLDGLLQNSWLAFRRACKAVTCCFGMIWGMAKGYRPVDREQPFLLPPDMRQWLPADHPVWLVIKVVAGHLDTSAFHAARRTGGAGAAGYDPDMLVTLLMWAYANEVTSSRRIEQLCATDVAFRVICAQGSPDHVTIARFRAALPGAVETLFGAVLVLCAKLGMGKLGTVALDGTKIAASASKAANRTEEGLRKLAAQRVAAHAATDAAEDELFGDGRRGDEVPPEVVSPASRDARIARALAELEAERKAAEQARDAQARAYLAALEAGEPPLGPPPAAAAVAAARARLDRAEAEQRAKLAAWEKQRAGEAAAGIKRRPGGRKPFAPEAHAGVAKARAALAQAEARAAEQDRKAAAKKGPGPVRNITDPDSRLMPVRGGGFLQGYNAQNVTSEDKLIIATELTRDPTGTEWFEPMLRQAQDAAALITAHRPPPPPGGQATTASPASQDIDLFLADAGYCSEHNLTTPGPDRLIATGKLRDLGKAASGATSAGPPARGEATMAMAARLATPEGITAYRQRGHIAETPHGHIKHNMRFRQLPVRGKPKAAAEWKFAATVHNLFKAITTGHLTSQALATLAT
jgi:transposase